MDGFKDSADLYCLSPAMWQGIDIDVAMMELPTAFGDAVRGVFGWKTWVKIISPIALRGRLPGIYSQHWLLTTDYTINDWPRIRLLLSRSVTEYETRYYRSKYWRLSACRAVTHALLHVADDMYWLGVREATFFCCPNLSLALLCLEQMIVSSSLLTCSVLTLVQMGMMG